jgi:hypothetical protein
LTIIIIITSIEWNKKENKQKEKKG